MAVIETQCTNTMNYCNLQYIQYVCLIISLYMVIQENVDELNMFIWLKQSSNIVISVLPIIYIHLASSDTHHNDPCDFVQPNNSNVCINNNSNNGYKQHPILNNPCWVGTGQYSYINSSVFDNFTICAKNDTNLYKPSLKLFLLAMILASGRPAQQAWNVEIFEN